MIPISYDIMEDSGVKILIVEDDKVSINFMRKFLKQFGTCYLAGSGNEAVEVFAEAVKGKEYFELICLDIMMPGMDGLETLKFIRELENQYDIPDENKVKIIMTSALNDQKTVTESYLSGCEAYVWKPVDMEKFKEIMKELNLI